MKTSIEKNLTKDSIELDSGTIYQINESGAQLFQDGKLVDSLDIATLSRDDNMIYIEHGEDVDARFIVETKNIVNDGEDNVVVSDENALAGLLPQPGLNGEPTIGDGVTSSYVDNISKEVDNTEDIPAAGIPIPNIKGTKSVNSVDSNDTTKILDDRDALFGDLSVLTKESVVSYVTDINTTSTMLVEESINDIILNMKTKVDVSRHIRKLIIENALKKCKLKAMEIAKADKLKIIELKRDIIKIQKELNDLQKKATPAQKIEIKRIQKDAEIEAKRELKPSIIKLKKVEESADDNLKSDHSSPKKKIDAVKERLNDKNEKVPEKCEKCGAKVGIFIKGEPIWQCTNKKCNKFYGVVSAEGINESTLDEYEFQKAVAEMMYEYTGETKYENMVKGYQYKIENYKDEDKDDTNTYTTESVASNITKKAADTINKSFNKVVYNNKDKIKDKKKDISNRRKALVAQLVKEKNHNKRANIENEIVKLNEQERMLTDQLHNLAQQHHQNQIQQQMNWQAQQMAHQAHVDAVNSAAMAHQMATGQPVGPVMCSTDVEDDFDAIYEARNMEDEIKPIVDAFEVKGYMVKYASPGHKKLRKKEDKEPDGVYYDKLYSDARIMFDDTYKFKGCPKGWFWREVDGCSYLDVAPKTYNEKDGTPDEAFAAWKKDYMDSLKDYVKKLDTNEASISENSNDNDSIKGYWTESDYMGLMPDGKYHKFEDEGSYKEAYNDEKTYNVEKLKQESVNYYNELTDFLFESVVENENL